MQKEGVVEIIAEKPMDAENIDLIDAIESIIEVYKEKKLAKEFPVIPLYLFSSRRLGVLEVLVKALKENFFLSYSNIAMLLNRDDRTIWATYRKARKKNLKKFEIRMDAYMVPCNVFSDRNLGPLEALTLYVKHKYDLNFKKISRLLNRNYNTIWISYQKGLRKRGNTDEG